MCTVRGDAYAHAIYAQLKAALHHGARASRLLRHSLDLVDLIAPATDDPGVECIDRARTTEKIIRAAITNVGGPLDDVAATLYGLKAGTRLPLKYRREQAAALLDIQPDTFARDWQDTILWDLTVEIYALATDNESTAGPASHCPVSCVRLLPTQGCCRQGAGTP